MDFAVGELTTPLYLNIFIYKLLAEIRACTARFIAVLRDYLIKTDFFDNSDYLPSRVKF